MEEIPGACEHVCPSSVAPDVAIQETAASKAGVHFCGADGGRMRNLGCQSWTAFTDAGTKTNIKVQVADRLHRTLFSVSRLTESGNRVVFDPDGSFIENKLTGHVTPLIHTDGTYKLELWMKTDDGNVVEGKSASILNNENLDYSNILSETPDSPCKECSGVCQVFRQRAFPWAQR